MCAFLPSCLIGLCTNLLLASTFHLSGWRCHLWYSGVWGNYNKSPTEHLQLVYWRRVLDLHQGYRCLGDHLRLPWNALFCQTCTYTHLYYKGPLGSQPHLFSLKHKNGMTPLDSTWGSFLSKHCESWVSKTNNKNRCPPQSSHTTTLASFVHIYAISPTISESWGHKNNTDFVRVLEGMKR